MTDRELAEAIADALFVKSAGCQADRLLLWRDTSKPGCLSWGPPHFGEWSHTDVVDCILKRLTERVTCAATEPR